MGCDTKEGEEKGRERQRKKERENGAGMKHNLRQRKEFIYISDCTRQKNQNLSLTASNWLRKSESSAGCANIELYLQQASFGLFELQKRQKKKNAVPATNASLAVLPVRPTRPTGR